MELEFEHNLDQDSEQVNSLNDILNSISQDSQIKNKEFNNTSINIIKNNSNKTNDYLETQLNDYLEIHLNEYLETHLNKYIKKELGLFTNEVDRKLGNYLLTEVDNKQLYISELEEVIKFQEKEISELKLKLDKLSKLELLTKIKSNMDEKLNEVETQKNDLMEKEKTTPQSTKQQVIQVKKSTQNQHENTSQYPPIHNPDLVLSYGSKPKVKQITKEEEEPRYNGVVIIDKPKKEQDVKIIMDYETDNNDSSELPTELIKQRRRALRL